MEGARDSLALSTAAREDPAMRFVISVVACLFLTSLTSAADESLASYSQLTSKQTKLVSVWGRPEQSNSWYTHTLLSADRKYALSLDYLLDDVTTLTLWNIPKATKLRTWTIKSDIVTAVALSPEGKRLIIGLTKPSTQKEDGRPEKEPAQKGDLTVWDTMSGQKLVHVESVTAVLTAAAFSPKGNLMLTGFHDKSLVLLDTKTWKPTRTFGKQSQAATALAFFRDASSVLIGDSDGGLSRLELKTGKISRRFEKGSANVITDIVVSNDARLAATLGTSKDIDIWSLPDGKRIRIIDMHTNVPGTADLVLSGELLFAIWSSLDSPPKAEPFCATWNIKSGKRLWKSKVPFRGYVSARVAKGEVLMGGASNAFIRADIKTGQIKSLWGKGHRGTITDLVVTPDRHVLSASQDHTIKLWDPKGGEIRTFIGHGNSVNSLAISGKRMVSASSDNTLRLWDRASGKLVRTLVGHKDSVTCVAVDRNGNFAASGAVDRTVRLWDLNTGKSTQTITGPTEQINDVLISPDGRWLVAACHDKQIYVWPMDGAKQIGEYELLEGHTKPVTSLAISADGKRLVSGSRDGSGRVWELSGTRQIRQLKGHTNWVSDVVWLDNDTAASSSDDLSIRIWDVRHGEEAERIDFSKCADFARCLVRQNRNNLMAGTAGWVVLGLQVRKRSH